MTPILAPALALCCLLPATALAETFTPVTRQQDFVNLVSGKDLTRFGIRLSVSPTGDISGRAFGRKVTGAWEWNGQYFCRELYVGSDDLGGPNCQAVLKNGDTLRFIADQGKGDHADLRLR
ncbi:MAG: dihydrodipicolinate reductase [Rhodobacteraceae bacterium]|jgi:hypothetical protein|nr:dihydrodipicolinate reductase [Paracoccaceae bacterium]